MCPALDPEDEILGWEKSAWGGSGRSARPAVRPSVRTFLVGHGDD